MTKEELKALGLTDEQVAKISEDYGKNYVAKSQFNEKNEALKNAEKEKGELSKQIEGLKRTMTVMRTLRNRLRLCRWLPRLWKQNMLRSLRR